MDRARTTRLLIDRPGFGKQPVIRPHHTSLPRGISRADGVEQVVSPFTIQLHRQRIEALADRDAGDDVAVEVRRVRGAPDVPGGSELGKAGWRLPEQSESRRHSPLKGTAPPRPHRCRSTQEEFSKPVFRMPVGVRLPFWQPRGELGEASLKCGPSHPVDMPRKAPDRPQEPSGRPRAARWAVYAPQGRFWCLLGPLRTVRLDIARARCAHIQQ